MFMLDDGCCAFATHTCDVILYIYWAPYIFACYVQLYVTSCTMMLPFVF